MTPLVLDIGSSSIRAGFAGTDQPRIVAPSCVGAQDPDRMIFPLNFGQKLGLTEVLPLSDPESMACAVDGALYGAHGLQANRHIHPVLFSRSPNEKKLIELLFEHSEVPSVFGVHVAALAAYATGRTSAMVADFGASTTSFSYVEDGGVKFHVPYAFGGDTLDGSIMRRLEIENPGMRIPPFYSSNHTATEVRTSFHNKSCLRTVQEVKNSICRVSPTPLPPAPERMRAAKKAAVGLGINFKFPDGTEVDTASVCEYVPELFFNPKIGDLKFIPNARNFPGVSAALQENFNNAPLKKLVLVGGCTLMPGFCARFVSEASSALGLPLQTLACLAPSQLHRPYATWTGGSVLGAMSAIDSLFVSSKEYYELGAERCVTRLG